MAMNPKKREPRKGGKVKKAMRGSGMANKKPLKKMRGGGMMKKMRGGGMMKKMRGGGMMKKMNKGGKTK